MDKSSRNAWERRPDESSKSFNAFQEYLKMPVRDIEDPDNSRTLANLSQKLGYAVAKGKSASTVEQWSSKFNWQERVKAYDEHKANLSIAVQDASIEQYQQEVVERRTLQATLMNKVIEGKIEDLLKRQKLGHDIDPLELLRMTTAINNVDVLERRIAGLPTNYTTEKVNDIEDNKKRIFIMGGD